MVNMLIPYMCGNFCGTKLWQFRGFCFRGCGPDLYYYFQFKMFELESCIRGFHVYYVLWTPREGKVLHCSREIANRVVFCNVHCVSRIDSYFIIVSTIIIHRLNFRG